MEKVEFINEKGEYSSSKGRWFKCIFENQEKTFLQIGETDDYFYFTIAKRQSLLKNTHTIVIDKSSLLYPIFYEMLSGFEYIEVMEEGSPEKKSLGFEKTSDSINIIFNLTEEERGFVQLNLQILEDLAIRSLKS